MIQREIKRTQVPLLDDVDSEKERHNEGEQLIRVYYSPDDDGTAAVEAATSASEVRSVEPKWPDEPSV